MGRHRQQVSFRGTPLESKKVFLEGMQRAVPPELTYSRLSRHLNRVGVTRLADITGLDRISIPTVLALRPNSPTLSSAAGKGATKLAATVSASMEAIEIYHAEAPKLPVLSGSYDDIAQKYNVIPKTDLPFSKYSLFSSKRSDHWVTGWDILHNIETVVPYALVSLTGPTSQRTGRWMEFTMGSNGLASGNTLAEAIVAGLYEVIERDAITCSLQGAQKGRDTLSKVALDSIEDPILGGLIDKYRKAEIELLLFDCTIDTQVACYMAVIYDRLMPHTATFAGYGAHLDPTIAMIRAATEAAQSRLVILAGSRDDVFPRDRRSLTMSSRLSIDTYKNLSPNRHAMLRRSESAETFEEDILTLMSKLEGIGINQIIVVELTDPTIGMSVARVIVPGLEGHMYEYYEPGRRALAFCEAATSSSQ